jgi:glyoxylase I family protein
MQLHVEHIGLPARDPRALSDWYVRTLGATPVDLGVAGPPFFISLPGGTVLEIYTAAANVPQTGENSVAGFRHLALRVASIAAAQAELAGKGVAFPEPAKPAAGGGQVLFFRDLEGNLLHFVERPAGFSLAPR